MTFGRLAMVVAIGALLAASCASAAPRSDSPDTAGSTDAPSTTSTLAPVTTNETPSPTTTDAPTVDSTMEPTDPTTSTTGTTSGSSSQIDPVVAPLVTIAIADLASHLGISEADIDASSAALVVWPDGGLGCPMPGMSYTQVQVDGYLIELTANGQTYSYHGGGGRGPFLCLNPTK